MSSKRITFVGTYNNKQISRVAEIPTSSSLDTAAFLSALFFDVPNDPCILSYLDNGTNVFVPLSDSSLASIPEGSVINVHFKGMCWCKEGRPIFSC